MSQVTDPSLGPDFGQIAEDFPGAIFVCELAPPWRVTYISPGVQAVCGWPAADLMAGRVHWASIVDSRDRAFVEATVADAVSTRRPYTIDYRIVDATGGTRRVHETGRPILDESGNPTRLAGTILDITDLDSARQEAEQLESALSALTELSPVAVLRFDTDAQCTSASSAWSKLTSRDPEEALGLGWADAIHPDDRDRVIRAWQDAVRAGGECQAEYRLLGKDGRTTWVIGQAAAIRGTSGEAVGYLATLVDNTGRKRVELAMRALSNDLAGLHGQRLLDRSTRLLVEATDADAGAYCHVPYGKDTPDILASYHREGMPNLTAECFGTSASAGAVRPDCLLDAGYASALAFPLTGDGGADLGFFVIAARRNFGDAAVLNDIGATFARTVGAEIDRSREHKLFQEVFSSSPDALIMTDRDGRIVMANDATSAVFGWPQSELLGKPVEVLVPEGSRARHEPLRRGYTAGGTPRLMGSDRVSVSGLRRDGSVFPAEVSLTTLAGDPPRVLAAVRDITERLALSRAAREALTTLDATDDGAYVFSPTTLRFSYVNEGACRQLGYTRVQLLRMTPLDVRPEVTEEEYRAMLASVQQSDPPKRRFVTEHRRSDDSRVPVEINLQYLAPRGEQPRFVAVVRDISERLKLEREAHRADRLQSIGRLAGGVAHDLNNALAPVLMGLDLLQPSRPEDKDIINTIMMSAHRGADVVRQLLTFVRGADGERTVLPPHTIIHEIEQVIRRTFPKNIVTDVHITAACPNVRANPTQLHQILLNLCVNARDAMPHGGLLSIDADLVELHKPRSSQGLPVPPGSYALIRVSDTGVGMSREILDDVFIPFFSTKSPNAGTGLGLSSVMGLVNAHGGYVIAESAVGRGSVFSVYLPATFEEPGTGPGVAPPKTRLKGRGRILLVVDDEPAIRTVMAEAAQRVGFRVVTATDGADALIHVTSCADVLSGIILDIQMPHLDGLSFVRALRRILPTIPVLATTGHLEESVAAELRHLGVEVHLLKPFANEQLLAALDRLL